MFFWAFSLLNFYWIQKMSGTRMATGLCLATFSDWLMVDHLQISDEHVSWWIAEWKLILSVLKIYGVKNTSKAKMTKPQLFLSVLKNTCVSYSINFWKHLEKSWDIFALIFQKNIEKVWDIEKI